jgi:hypothetical protein
MFKANGELGALLVQTTENRGFTPEEVAERALDKIMHVGDNAPDEIRAQAIAVKDKLRGVLVYYMHEAVKSDRTSLAIKFKQAGHPELVSLLDQGATYGNYSSNGYIV